MAQAALIVRPLVILHSDRGLPLSPENILVPSAEPHAPPFKDKNLDLLLTWLVDRFPLRLRDPVALPAERRFIVLRNRGGPARAERCEDGLGEWKVVCAWLAAVLEERICRVVLCELDLVVVGEVEVVEGESDDGERVWRRAEGGLQRGHLDRHQLLSYFLFFFHPTMSM